MEDILSIVIILFLVLVGWLFIKVVKFSMAATFFHPGWALFIILLAFGVVATIVFLIYYFGIYSEQGQEIMALWVGALLSLLKKEKFLN